MTKTIQIVVDGYELKSLVDAMLLSDTQKVAVYDTAINYVALNFIGEVGKNNGGYGYTKLKYDTETISSVSFGDDVFNVIESVVQEDDEGEREMDYDLVHRLTKQTIEITSLLTQQLIVTFTRLFPNPESIDELVDFSFQEERGCDLVYALTYATAS